MVRVRDARAGQDNLGRFSLRDKAQALGILTTHVRTRDKYPEISR